jgi:prolyl oligopeptidase|tara:strand:+ start:277 stop:2505 length:2229 start_codon:yes stop_codon:yes gene_type:complete
MAPTENTPDDVFLEDLQGERSMEWVTKENTRAIAAISGPDGTPERDPLFAKLRAIYDDEKKIPNVRLRGDFVYNFWQDDAHVKGIWRRTTMGDFKLKDPTWETVLDVDALSAAEQKSWVWKGPSFLDYGPGDDAFRVDRCVVKLSDGGTDACVVREFDVTTKTFVGDDEKPFVLPVGKSNFCWIDRDTAWIGADFGEGTVSPSGYPLTIREWKRGEALPDSTEIWRGQPTDVVAAGSAYWDKGVRYQVWYRAKTFYDTEHFALHPDTKTMVLVDIPSDFGFNTFADHVVIHCKSAWEVGSLKFKAGCVVAHPADAFVRGDRSQFTELYVPKDERCSYAGSTETKDYLLIHTLEHMVVRVYVWRFVKAAVGDDATKAAGDARTKNKSTFQFVKEHVAPDCQSFEANGIDADRSNELWVTTDGYLDPVTLSTACAPDLEISAPCKENTAWFDTNGMTVELREAVSDDGTAVPYFLVKGAGVVDGGAPVPTVLYGYGGFEISMLPGYSATVGESFLSNGMCYAVACIRGGGEFGARWHRAAKKEKRWRAYEDFAAVAKDLVATKVTTHQTLGCMGGSNGGLLAGAMMVHYPNLFGAVVSQCPLLDMERYVLLTSGPSWIDEYGDPSVPEERAALLGFSPYHNLEKSIARATAEWGFDAEAAKRGEHVPATLFTTSTADDRVHPSHARRVVHKMRALGIGGKVLYHEMIEGGHAGAADNVARAKVKTVENRFLLDVLKNGKTVNGR